MSPFEDEVASAWRRLEECQDPTQFDFVPLRPGSGHLIRVAYEGHQPSGSHLVRAAHLAVIDAPPHKRIVCASRGNFGAAVACAAARFDYDAVIFVPEGTSIAKLAAIYRYCPMGVEQVRGSFHDAERAAADYALKSDGHLVSGSNGRLAMVAAGTLAYEIDVAQPGITDVLVPTGGGALVGGIAEYFRGRVRVVSVETERTGSMFAAFVAGRPVETTVGGRAADSLGVPKVGDHGFAAARRWNATSVVVSDDAAVRAQEELWMLCHFPAEIGAVAPLAALWDERYEPPNDARVVAVVTGSNLTIADLMRLDACRTEPPA
jgi:threonine dehydratase